MNTGLKFIHFSTGDIFYQYQLNPVPVENIQGSVSLGDNRALQ